MGIKVDDLHWYQSPWVWLVICLPFTAVVFGIFMFVEANTHRDDLVVDNYYKVGMAINETLAMEDKAAQLNIHATLKELSAASIVFTITNANDSAVTISLYHVSDSQQDRSAVLLPGAGHEYRLTDNQQFLEPFKHPGIWYLELAGVDDHWRLQTRLVMPVTGLEIDP